MRDAEIMSALKTSATMVGMNVSSIPLAQNEHGFWIIATLIASFTGIAG